MTNTADGIFQTAIPLVTLGITRDPTAFATVTLAMRLPWLLFALPAGALADRLDRRRTMVLINLGRALVIGTLALLVAGGSQALWLLCVVAFTLGTAETMHDTAAQSVVPNLVGTTELPRANSRLYSVELIMNRFVGPPLGGLLVAATAVGALSATAAAYALAVLALLMIRGKYRPVRTGPPTRLRRDIAEGVRFLYRHRPLRTLALLSGIANLTSIAVFSVFPLYAVRPGALGLSEVGFGLLLTAEAGGALLGSLVATRLITTLGNKWALLLVWSVFAVALAVRPVGDSVPVVVVSLVAEGAAFAVWNVITLSLRQRIVPDELLGRVNAGYRLMAWGAMPVGALLGGLAGGFFGVTVVFAIGAVVIGAAIPLLLLGLNKLTANTGSQ